MIHSWWCRHHFGDLKSKFTGKKCSTIAIFVPSCCNDFCCDNWYFSNIRITFHGSFAGPAAAFTQFLLLQSPCLVPKQNFPTNCNWQIFILCDLSNVWHLHEHFHWHILPHEHITTKDCKIFEASEIKMSTKSKPLLIFFFFPINTEQFDSQYKKNQWKILLMDRENVMESSSI